MAVWAALVIAGVVTIIWGVKRGQNAHFPIPFFAKETKSGPEAAILSVEIRRRLAESLSKIQREMDARSGEVVVGGRWSLEVGEAAAILDPRLAIGSSSRRPSARNDDGGDEGDEEDLSSVISAIVPASGWPPERVRRVVAGLSSSRHNVSVVVLRREGDAPVDAGGASLRPGALAAAAEAATTPFVFVGDSLEDFSWRLSPLGRLVRALEGVGAGAGVAGGALRAPDGRWRHGCLQRALTNYEATFVRGYRHSALDCMLCDDVSGPVVARAEALRRGALLPPEARLGARAARRDWHARLGRAGFLALVCPDVMFLVEEDEAGDALGMTRASWRALAAAWAVQTVRVHGLLREEVVHEFSCPEVGLTCEGLRERVASSLIPPCCRALVEEGVGVLADFAASRGVALQLRRGSLLAAVKLGAHLPWDFDQDVRYDCRDRRAWQEGLPPFLRASSSSCRLGASVGGGFLVLRCDAFSVDMPCSEGLSSSSLRTWVPYRGGRAVGVPPNPGAAARREYGPDALKHAHHWRVRPRPPPGAWRPCPTPSAHHCLDKYPADGSLPFRSPPLCLP